MAAVSIHDELHQITPYRPWYRRATVLVSVAMIAGLSGWVSGLFELPLLTRPAPTLTPSKSVATPTEAPTYVVPSQPTGNDASLSSVPLPLLLTGTMPGRNSREGQAFIGVDKDSPQTYTAGAILANNARIAEIYTDHVVLEKDGKQVNLYLHGSGKTSDAKQLAGILTVGGAPSPTPAKITHHDVLTDYIRPSPVYDGQRLKGYQVYPGQNAGVFSQLGLQPGDVITHLNNVPLNEPTSAIEQLKQLTEGYAITASIERNNKIETLSLDGGMITADQERQRNPPASPTLNMPTM